MASYEQSFGSDEPDSTHHLVTIQPIGTDRGFGTVKPPLSKNALEKLFGTHKVDDKSTVKITDDSGLMLEGSAQPWTLFSYEVLPVGDMTPPMPEGFGDIDVVDLAPEAAEQYLVAHNAEMKKVASDIGKIVLEIADSVR